MLITEIHNSLNIDFNCTGDNDVRIWKDQFGSHVQIGNKCYGDSMNLTKICSYLYEITIDDYDWSMYQELMKDYKLDGACSGLRYENWFGRNYDWFYDNSATFILRVPAKNGRHQSIGLSTYKTITDSIADSNEGNYAYQSLPFHTLDGINDAGVVCSINVVPMDKGLTTGTNPGKQLIYQFTMPRVILDYANSALDGIKKLNNYNIVSTSKVIGYELHMLVADANSTYIVEFVNNKMHVMSDQDDEFDDIPGEYPIMTNFHLSGWNGEIKTVQLGNTEQEVKNTGLERHADGVERYKILSEHITECSSLESTLDVMRNVQYSKMYTEKDTNPWYSECNGFSKELGELSIYSPADSFKPVFDVMYDQYVNRDRNKPDTWQTVHSTAYDFVNKQMMIRVQEEDATYNFSLDVNKET